MCVECVFVSTKVGGQEPQCTYVRTYDFLCPSHIRSGKGSTEYLGYSTYGTVRPYGSVPNLRSVRISRLQTCG